MRFTRSSKAASVGGLCYPSLTTALLARHRIDFAVRCAGCNTMGIRCRCMPDIFSIEVCSCCRLNVRIDLILLPDCKRQL